MEAHLNLIEQVCISTINKLGLRSGLLEKHNGQDREKKGLDDLIGEKF